MTYPLRIIHGIQTHPLIATRPFVFIPLDPESHSAYKRALC
jgi:hypothetical protein